ncbi:MAG: hypothetical protein PHQ60_01155 [Sideroxydans sp.]|nr:hypothetical protein [Sideroxydans sp.]
MKTTIKSISASVFILAMTTGCSAPQPVPFQLVDPASKIQKGTIFPDGQRIEAVVDGQLYKGFYIVASGVAYSQSFGGASPFSRNMVATYSSNSVRAQLTSDTGQRLSCEFLFESRRAIGECRSPAGAVYQLSADQK